MIPSQFCEETGATYLGTFECNGTLAVCDPAYKPGSRGYYEIQNAREGMWDAFIMVSDAGVWGRRVSELFVCHTAGSQVYPAVPEYDAELGVDSGCMGIYDAQSFADECEYDYFREWVWDAVSDYGNTIAEMGVVCSSGMGDGVYPLYTNRGDNGYGDMVDAVAVTFFDPEDY